MFKKFSITLLVLVSLFVASPVFAEDETNCVQVTQYGGAVGIVCGAHEPVETGLADINPIILSFLFFALSGASLIKAKKLARTEVVL